MAAMSGSGQFYLFGGAADMDDKSAEGVGAPSNDLWMYDDDFDPGTDDWRMLVANNDKCSSSDTQAQGDGDPCAASDPLEGRCCPAKRSGHMSTTYGFSTMGRVVIFGGEDAGGGLLNDAWTLESGVGKHWKRVAADGNQLVRARKDSGGAGIDFTMYVFGGIMEGTVLGQKELVITNELVAFEPGSAGAISFDVKAADDDDCVLANTCPTKRHLSGLAAVGTALILFGGATSADGWQCSNDVWSFQTKTTKIGEKQKWSILNAGVDAAGEAAPEARHVCRCVSPQCCCVPPQFHLTLLLLLLPPPPLLLTPPFLWTKIWPCVGWLPEGRRPGIQWPAVRVRWNQRPSR
jgi:hypothetical protein